MFENAMWIKPKYNCGQLCPIFKKDFSICKKIKRAVLNITAMGVYEAWINGERIGDFIMAPGWTAYDKRHQYQTYDVTQMLKENNVLSVTVGKGWYRGRISVLNYNDVWGGVYAVIAQLDIEYADGTMESIFTNQEWETAESAIKFSEIYDGETYDARFIPKEWQTACELKAPKSQLIAQEGETVKEAELFKPVKFINTPKGEKVIDFGQNLTGYVYFDINAKAGEKLVYTHAEVLDRDGNFYTGNLRSAKQRVEYICKDGKQSYKPHHTFMGFRYIRLEEVPDGVEHTDFEAIAVYSDIKRMGNFSCSHDKINQLFSNIIWGQKGNFLDVPTDCPQRDERLGWTADAQIFIKTAAYNFDVQRFFKKWLRDLKSEQFENGNVPCVVPNPMGAMGGHAGWGDAAVICPWQLYLHYDDKEVLSEQLDSMIAWVEYMHSRGDEEFLWLGDKQNGDWLALDAPEGSYKGRSHTDFLASAYFAYSCELLVKILRILGKDAEKYENMHKNILKSFKKKFTEYTTQTECIIALKFNLTDDRKKTAMQLAELIKDCGTSLQTGFMGTPYLLETLSENGYEKIAYDLLLREEYPSWLFSVNMGATTVWEHWDSQKEDGSFWSDDMNSFNHYAYGAVASWMYEYIAGIRIDENAPGFSHIILKPVTDERLTWARAEVETKFGVIKSRWERKDGFVNYEFDVPVSASLLINGMTEELAPGHYEFRIAE